MNFTSLHYFLTVAEELNITKAAEKLFISQQSLSEQITRLEKELNTTLFERKPTLRLTYSGVCMVRYAKEILELQNQMLLQMDSIASNKVGYLSVGTTSMRSKLFITDFLPIYKERYPNVELNVYVGHNEYIRKKLQKKELDLIICMEYPSESEVEQIELYRDNFSVLIPSRFIRDRYQEAAPDEIKRQKEKRTIDISLFDDLPILMPKGTFIHTVVEKFFQENHIVPKIILESNDTDTMLNLSANGMGATFCFQRYAGKFIDSLNMQHYTEKLEQFTLDDPNLQGRVVIACLRDRYKNFAVDGFIKLANQFYSKGSFVSTI